MRDWNGIKIIAVDHGYGNVKTANTVTSTGLVAYDTEPIFSGSILEYDGTFYRVGEGHKPFVADKATDNDNYVLTLMAIAKELNIAGIREADVHLAAGLPMTWIRRQRKDFRAYLLRNERVAFRFNGKEYHVRFVGCRLFPQGYPAIINRLSEFKGTSVLADIGNGTMNVLYLANRKPVESKCWTEKLGVDQCVTAARNAVLDNHGVKIDDGIVEQVLRTGTADIAKPYLDCITGAARQYAGMIFDTLRRYEYNPDLMRLYVVGGGGCVLRHFGEYDKERVSIIEDICATAKSNAQVILRWHTQVGDVVIPGSKNVDHIRDNINIFDFTLTDDELAAIAKVDQGKRYYTATEDALQGYLQFAPDFNEQP